MPHEIILREQYGLGGHELVYIKPPDQNVIVQLDSSFPRTLTSSLRKGVRNFLCTVFLPQGYPESVSKDYLPYQLWDTLQAFASTLNGTLTTHAIMKGVGVGDEAASPLAAAITWIVKDGAGNMGRILFAWWKGTSLDSDCKKWRLCADILNDFAMFLELLLPHFIGFSTTLLCFSTILKSIVGVAGGATRATLTQHQAVRDNMADVSAKDGSQETCVNLLASILGIFVLMTTEDKRYVWPLFSLFTTIHLYANYRAVKCLVMSTLNKARLNLIIREYLKTGNIPHPVEVNCLEAVILGQGLSGRDLCGYDIEVGKSLSGALSNEVVTADQLKLIINLYRSHNYLILLSKKHKKIFVSLKQGSVTASCEAVQAYWHAALSGIASNIVDGKETVCLNPEGVVEEENSLPFKRLRDSVLCLCSKPIGQQAPQRLPVEAIMATNEFSAFESKEFLRCLRAAGWSTSGHHLGCDEWRCNWSTANKTSTQ